MPTVKQKFWMALVCAVIMFGGAYFNDLGGHKQLAESMESVGGLGLFVVVLSAI